MPRYNTDKQQLQEVPCDDDYFSPILMESNRFRYNGPNHCMYRKISCVLKGMRICSNGSTTVDRTCYCDYMNNYVSEFALPQGKKCFDEQDNRCIRRDTCTYPSHKLNECKYVKRWSWLASYI